VTYFLTPEADEELTDAVAFCAQQFSVAVAENFLATFELKVDLIAEFPGVGTATSKGRRLFPLGRYPYSILYRVDNGVVQISAIAHHSRQPDYWRKRK
jgi:toxin ParE1/3/4